MSSSFCLSSATILRCVPLSLFQIIVVLVPTTLELLFNSFLIIILWNSGHRRHLLLIAESWIYFILSILELLTHVLKSSQSNVEAFSALDITIGVASFLPLFFYCFFLYVYLDSELLPNVVSLPKKLGRVASLLLLILIPAILGVNEVASFVGVERRTDSGAPDQVFNGFGSQSSYSLNTFFSSLSLALVALFQVIIFLITGFRLATAIINQRRFEDLGQDATHLVKGIGWLSAGLKIGAIETVIGFAGGEFEVVITRRIFRFLGRACLCIGIVKGVDEIEDFRAVKRELSTFKRSQYLKENPRGMKKFISNPRMSTFQQLPPTANGFYSLPRAHLLANSTFDFNRDEKPLGYNPVTPKGQLRPLQDLGGITTFETQGKFTTKPKERVTVHYRHSGGAPTLLLRLSMAGFPSPINSRFSESRPGTEWIQPISRSQSYTVSQGDYRWSDKFDNSLYAVDGLTRTPIPTDHGKQWRGSTTKSITDSVVEIVIAPQRTLSQRSARAHLYQPREYTAPTAQSPSTQNTLREESSSPQLCQESNGATSSKLRAVSDYSIQSLPDTLQAVRDLTREFPGPPLTYNGRPVLGGLQLNAWDDDDTIPAVPSLFGRKSRTSFVASTYGPPVGLPTPEWKDVNRLRQKVEDEERDINRYAPKPLIMPPGNERKSPANAPRLLVSAAGNSALQRADKPLSKAKPSMKSTAAFSSHSIDPFDDDQSPSTPVQRIINRPTILRPQPHLDTSALQPSHKVSAPSTWYNLTPRASRAEEAPSNPCKYDPPVFPPPGEGLPSTPVRFSGMTIDPANSRFIFPSASSTSLDRTPGRRSPAPSRVVWITQGNHDQPLEQQPAARRVSSEEEERRRQQSIDAAARTLGNSIIPWLKDPGTEEEEWKLEDAMKATARRAASQPNISRVKTVGSVVATPKHATGPMRRSLRVQVEPIVVPPPSGSYAQVVVVTDGENAEDNL